MSHPVVHASSDIDHKTTSLPVFTTENIPGHTVVHAIGMVRGSTIRSRHLGHDIMAGLRNLVGGEIHEYTKMIAESREQALDRMVAEALARGANAVVGTRFTTTTVSNAAAEILVYGTAVVIEPHP